MRLLLTMLLLLLMASPGMADEADARVPDATGKVEAKLNVEGDLWVGQRVPMTVKIWAPGFSIDGIPTFDIPEISGLIVMKLPGSPAIGNETIADVTYVTQLHEFALFPQRSGEFNIPAFPVRFASSAGYGKPVSSFELKTAPLKFTAQLPSGAENLRTLISTTQLTFAETWSSDANSFKVGDAVTRTITMKADDVPGMEFPPLTFDPIDGVGVYPKPASVSDNSHRGTLSGQRVESVTYVFEKPGSDSLPGFSLTWWKLDEKILKHETIAGRTIVVTDIVPVADTEKPNATPHKFSWTVITEIITSLIIVVVLLAFVSYWNRIPANEEAVRFAALEAACHKNDPGEILSALTVWLDQTSAEPIILSQWGAQTGDPILVELISQLEASFYQKSRESMTVRFPGRALLRRLRTIRHHQTHISDVSLQRAPLGPLNPMSS